MKEDLYQIHNLEVISDIGSLRDDVRERLVAGRHFENELRRNKNKKNRKRSNNQFRLSPSSFAGVVVVAEVVVVVGRGGCLSLVTDSTDIVSLIASVVFVDPRRAIPRGYRRRVFLAIMLLSFVEILYVISPISSHKQRHKTHTRENT